MTDFCLLTTWRIEAPLADVYAEIEDSLSWPAWWPAVKKVEQLAAGKVSGVGNLRRYCWQGKLPSQVNFDICTTRIEPKITIEGTASGDLEGAGRWYFSHRGKVCIIRYEWQVRGTRWWMSLLNPVVNMMFVGNHTEIMAQGGEGLARRLNARLVSAETVDLMAGGGPRKLLPEAMPAGGRWPFSASR